MIIRIYQPIKYLYLTLCFLICGVAFAQKDNGLPASKADEFRQKYGPKNSSAWKSYENTKTGDEVSLDPRTEEVWFNPATKKYEVIQREESPDPLESYKKKDGTPAIYQKTELRFNPATKKYEKVLVEVAPPSASTPVQYPQSLDNGLPASTAKNWVQEYDETTSSSWKRYRNKVTGQLVKFDPSTSELWYNPVKEKWEPVKRERTVQEAYIKKVARDYLYKTRPAGATKWRCHAYGTVHNDPGQCADPDRGGVWLP